MKKIEKHILTENLKSRMTGLLPFYRVKDQSVYIHSFFESKPKIFGENIDDFKFFHETDLINGNWGENVFDFIPNLDLSFKETFVLDGKKVFSYHDLRKRYNEVIELSDNMICMKAFYNFNERKWKRIQCPQFLERRNYEIYDPSEIGFKNNDDINEIFDKLGFVLDRGSKIWEDNKEILIIENSSRFNELGGFHLIDFFEEILGIIKVDNNLVNENVSEYIHYWEIEELYDWLNRHKNDRQIDTFNTWIGLGGDKMIEFLERTDLRDDMERPVDFLSTTLNKISQFEYSFPCIEINLCLENSLQNIGLLSPGSEIFLDESGNEKSFKEELTKEGGLLHKLFNDSEEISCKSETQLNTLKSRFLTYDDNGNALPGILNNKTFNGKPYILRREKNKWYGDSLKEGNNNYISCSFIETAIKRNDAKSGNHIFKIEYDNGITYENKVPAPSEYFKKVINNKGEEELEWYKNKKRINYELYYKNVIPEDTKKIYKAKKNIFKEIIDEDTKEKIITDEIIINKNNFFKYDSGLKKWDVIKEPSIILENLVEEKDYVVVHEKIGSKDIEKLYKLSNGKEYGFIGDEFYKTHIVSSNIPFNEYKPYNIIPIDDEFCYADFISKIEKLNNGKVKFTYYLYCKCKIEKNKTEDNIFSLMDTYNDVVSFDENSGIRYEETYSVKTNVKCIGEFDEYYTVDENGNIKSNLYKIDCFFDEIDFERSKQTHKKFGLQRMAIQSDIKYQSNDVWKLDNNEITFYNTLKEDYLVGVDHINKPNINIVINRGNASAFEPHFKLMECNTLQDLENYGNNYFNLK